MTLRALASVLLLGLPVVAAACGSVAKGNPSVVDHDSGTAVDRDSGTAVDHDSGSSASCPSIDAGLLANGYGSSQELAQGNVAGAGVECNLCTLGALVIVSAGNDSLAINGNAPTVGGWSSAAVTGGHRFATPSTFNT